MTPFVWMFIKTYEKLREYIIRNKAISSLIQMEYSAFEEATVPICSFVLKNGKAKETAYCIRLSDFKGGMEVQKKKVLEALENKECGYFYESVQNVFLDIPGQPIAYWISKAIRETFINGKSLIDYASVKKGLDTGNNDKYLRLWFEVEAFISDSRFHSQYNKWIPLQKGGGFRKWYGNNEYVINWGNNGHELKMSGKASIRSPQFYYKEGISWSTISSSYLGMRYVPEGFIFETAGNMMFLTEKEKMYYCLGFLCGKIPPLIMGCLNPTITTTVGSISLLPIIFRKDQYNIINKIVKKAINIEKRDWDSFETSWDFQSHPLAVSPRDHQEQLSYNMKSEQRFKSVSSVGERFKLWTQECDNRFNELKQNEEELNRIFIDIYGLQDELTSEVEDKDVTVRKADLQRDIKSLISYAVGCMFGRYSLDKEGLVYAGGNWEETYSYYGGTFADCGGIPLDGRYTFNEIGSKFYYYPVEGKGALECYKVDADNIIPITDEEYFEDDIVGMFCDWLKQVYGVETLEENLDFIAKALGNKGDSSREIIRNYFLKDFFTDHCKVYQKRPIYWLFDSGKENGFKALVYLHRYDADTVGRVRTDYLHKEQGYVEAALRSAEYTIENSSSSSEKSKATKAVAKYTKQLAEMRLYDEAIAHIANQRIELDLDDGVKVNYEKYQGIEVSREGQKAVKVNLLSKIK